MFGKLLSNKNKNGGRKRRRPSTGGCSLETTKAFFGKHVIIEIFKYMRIIIFPDVDFLLKKNRRRPHRRRPSTGVFIVVLETSNHPS